MAELVKCLPLKREDVSPIPGTYVKSVVVLTCNSKVGEAETGGFLKLVGQSA